MNDITKDEWEEWASMPQTRAVIKKIEEFIMSYICGYSGMPRELWMPRLDQAMGMNLIIEMIKEIHKEG